MAVLSDWVTQVCGALGLPPEANQQSLVLDLARDVAHQVARPAAPLTAYLVGVAVGRGTDPAAAAAAISALMREWSSEVEEGDRRPSQDS